MSIIKVENLTKQFKRTKRKKGFFGAIKTLFSNEYEIKTAVHDVSFSVEKGEIVGYIGPNGAGKSTTIKTLVGILVPTSGNAEVKGIIPYQSRIENARNIGVVFGQRTQLWWDIPVVDSINLMRHMYKIPDVLFEENMKIFSQVLGIDEFINTPVRQLSLGQRMRADLCVSLLHSPDILYLDEPTIGLDVVVKENIRNFIKKINKEMGTTIVLTTHDMDDIEMLCHRLIVIDKGHLMYDGDMGSLKAKYGSSERLTIITEKSDVDLKGLLALGVSEFKYNGIKADIQYETDKINAMGILEWMMQRCRVKDFSIHQVDIEEVIRKMYRELEERRKMMR